MVPDVMLDLGFAAGISQFQQLLIHCIGILDILFQKAVANSGLSRQNGGVSLFSGIAVRLYDKAVLLDPAQPAPRYSGHSFQFSQIHIRNFEIFSVFLLHLFQCLCYSFL